MRKTAIALFLAGTLASAAAWSQATIVSLEDAIEASTEYVDVPSSPSGPWRISACPGCASHQVTLDAETEYFVGKTAVPFATLRQYAARGPQHLDVYYEPKTGRVTRVVLRAQMDSADSAAPAGKPRRGGA